MIHCLPSGSGTLDSVPSTEKKKTFRFSVGKIHKSNHGEARLKIYQGVSIKEAHFKGRKRVFFKINLEFLFSIFISLLLILNIFFKVVKN